MEYIFSKIQKCENIVFCHINSSTPVTSDYNSSIFHFIKNMKYLQNLLCIDIGNRCIGKNGVDEVIDNLNYFRHLVKLDFGINNINEIELNALKCKIRGLPISQLNFKASFINTYDKMSAIIREIRTINPNAIINIKP